MLLGTLGTILVGVGIAVLNYKLSDSSSVSEYIDSTTKKAKRDAEDYACQQSRNRERTPEQRAYYKEKHENLREERRAAEREARDAAREAREAEYAGQEWSEE